MESVSTDSEQAPDLDVARAELELLRAQLMEASRMAAIGGLLASIVHEINTPIGSILSNNEVTLRSLEVVKKALVECGAPDDATQKKALQMLDMIGGLVAVDKIACERISAVIRGLKTFSRVDDSRPREADLHENLKGMLKLVGCEFRRRVAVETDLGAIPKVECYPQMMNQVFLNLLVNAGQAIEAEGKVTVRTRLEGEDSIRISISDTGHGIPPERMEKLFVPGFTTKPVGIGTGLGLSISKQIVEKHGGRIEVESRVGEGTTFHVVIPLKQQ